MMATQSSARKKFVTKFTLSFLLIFILAFMLTGFWVAKLLQQTSLERLKDSLEQQLKIIHYQLPLEHVQSSNVSEMQNFIVPLGEKIKSRITVINKEGMVLADSKRSLQQVHEMDNHKTRPELAPALRGQFASSIRHSNTLKQDMLYVAMPVSDGEIWGALRIALSLGEVTSILSTVRHPILLTSMGGIVIVTLVIALYAHRLSKRMKQITDLAGRYVSGDFDENESFNSDDELDILAESIYRLARSSKRH